MLKGSVVMAQNDRFTTVAEKLISAVNAADVQAIQKLFNPEMQKAVPEDKTREFVTSLLQANGKITKLGEVRIDGRTARFPLTFERGTLDMVLTLDDQGLIAGLLVVPSTPDLPVPERNTTLLSLPFRGEWFVFWGGATQEQNYHVNTRNQRRAVDFVMCDPQGKSHRGEGKNNEDYYCYGKEILAPAAGTVVTAIDGVPDNPPGSLNPYSGVGNCLILRHAGVEFSVLAHLQPRSLRVKVGDQVKAGQVLGKCGNSGNSSEPHLHFHTQNTAVLQDGTGFAPYFRSVRVTREGKVKVEPDYTPVRGDRIQSAQ
ncbi:MAG: peptidoglycan DD-metalloendopeptidase family protein [Armatimonadetes bacterium]|nr:peptidoglycan DD-metalloendopeptidase family protein [Armatimonadota bacterium]